MLQVRPKSIGRFPIKFGLISLAELFFFLSCKDGQCNSFSSWYFYS